jgi:NADH:ubiquinone oxidoreductase subunit 2 (subunit N)
MLTLNSVTDVNVLLYSYMFIYNLSLISFFWTFFSLVNSNSSSLYSLSYLSYNSFYNFNFTVLLFSMAGVPPFIGFFSKLFIILILLNNGFFLLYALLIIVLFLGLYFYVQNIRFLHSTNHKSANTPDLLNERVSLPLIYFAVQLLVFVSLGLSFVDDVVLLFTWIFF